MLFLMFIVFSCLFVIYIVETSIYYTGICVFIYVENLIFKSLRVFRRAAFSYMNVWEIVSHAIKNISSDHFDTN